MKINCSLIGYNKYKERREQSRPQKKRKHSIEQRKNSKRAGEENKTKFKPGADSAIKHQPTTENTGEPDAEREPGNKGWAFDGVSSGVFMTRQRQQRNELTDQSFPPCPAGSIALF